MTTAYTVIEDLAALGEMPADGTLSQTLYNDERMKIVLFNFSAGQELSEHTSSSPASLHFLSGESELTLGEDNIMARAGTWIHMPPQLPHSIRTKTAVTMLLTLLKSGANPNSGLVS